MKEGLYLPNGEFRSKLEIEGAISAQAIQAGLDTVVHRNNIYPNQEQYDLSRQLGNPFHFGMVSDTHLASKQERLHELNEMYHTFQREGVRVVIHCGDLTDGYGVYKGQEFEVKCAGQDQQVEYAVANYPKVAGIDTYFITGNHDLRQYEKGGIDVGKSISQQRPDLHYLGQMAAKITMAQGGTMEMLHPDGGVAYAMSYKAQRSINNLTPDNIPSIMAWGHYHGSFYMNYRGINFNQVPCFKGQGLWEKRLGLNPTIGGWIIDGQIQSGKVNRYKPTLFTY